MTAHAARRQRIAPGQRLAVKRFGMLGLLVGMTIAAVNLGRRRGGDVLAFEIGVASGAGECRMDRAAEALAIDIDRYGLLAMLGCHGLVAVTSQACVVVSFGA